MRFAYATGSRPLDGYTIKRGIGVGGFGEVYFAISDAGKEVAVKRIQRNMDVEIRGVSQCLNLKHPNLISLFDIKYDDEGQAWVVMEYVTGESLTDVIDRNPNGMPLADVREWFRGIAAGVAYLHDQGIVHRDLKPGNIFVDQDVVKIGDYGLSKYISCSRRSGQTESVGTFHYMAPEIGKGVYGKEIDVYALGIILYEMLTGRVPFDGESSQEIIMKHLTAEPDLIYIPRQFRPLIQRALLKDPAHRFPTVGQMLASFESADSGAAIEVLENAPVQAAMGAPSKKTKWVSDETRPVADEAEMEGMYFGPLQEIVAAEAVPESPSPAVSASPEPIAKAVRDGYSGMVSWWRHAHLSGPIKVLLILGVVFLLILNSNWLIPLAITLGAFYLVYFGIRSLVLALNASPAPAVPPRPSRTVSTAAGPDRRRRIRPRTRRKWQDEAREDFSKRSKSERVGELSGALLMSAMAAGVLCLVMMIVAKKPLNDSVFTWTFYAWFTLTSVAGAWIVLAISKFWEGGEGDQVRRRFVMLVAGLILGVAAFGLSDFLDVRPTDDLVVRSLPGAQVSTSMYEPDGSLKLPAFLVYFGGLFVILRWWLQADPLRSTRLSLWATGGCVFWALILHQFWPFPQPWGFMLAATISIAVQLSAPCLTPKERALFRQRIQEV